jgi:hypothetical protein
MFMEKVYDVIGHYPDPPDRGDPSVPVGRGAVSTTFSTTQARTGLPRSAIARTCSGTSSMTARGKASE